MTEADIAWNSIQSKAEFGKSGVRQKRRSAKAAFGLGHCIPCLPIVLLRCRRDPKCHGAIEIAWIVGLAGHNLTGDEPNGEWVVATNKGDIACEHVVSATGNFARKTGAMASLEGSPVNSPESTTVP